MTNSATFSVKAHKSVDVIEIIGRVDSNNAPDLDAILDELMGSGRYKLVLDLGGITYMSSAGLRAMVGALRTCKKNSGDVFLANPSERVQEVLALAGLGSVFQAFDNQVDAVGNF